MPSSPLAPWGRILAIEPIPATPAALRVLRRSAVRILITTLRQARSAREAADWLGMTYRSLVRLVDDQRERTPTISDAYERIVQTEHRRLAKR